jgi:hypothetical protein
MEINNTFSAFPQPGRKEIKGSSLGYRVLKEILSWNLSISVFLNDWRVENYISLAARITSLEIFSLIFAASYFIFPPLRTNEDVIYYVSFNAGVFYVLFFHVTKYIHRSIVQMQVIRHVKNSSRMLYQRIGGFMLIANAFGLFALFTIKEMYEYHTRFFWWNH